MTKPRLLMSITLAELGGAQTHVASLLPGVIPHFDTHLAVGVDGPLGDYARQLGIRVHVLKSLRREIDVASDAYAIRDFRRLLTTVRPDLVHAHSSKAGMVARIASRSQRIPCIFTAHGWGFMPGISLKRRWLVWALEAALAPLSAAIISVSKYDNNLAARYLVGNCSQRKVILNGVEDSPLLASPETPGATVAMAARFQSQKDHETLVRAFESVTLPNARLMLIGSGPGVQQIQQLVSSLGLEQRVDFLGDRRDVAELLTTVQVFVLLSHYEGLPISILEAMRAGLPVIATCVGGVPEEVDHGKTGYLVSPRNKHEVSEALNLLCGNPAARKRLGDAGRSKFLAEFTAGRMVQSTLDVYRFVMSDRNGPVSR